MLKIVKRGGRLYAVGTEDGVRIRKSLKLRVGQEAEAKRLLKRMEKGVVSCFEDVAKSYLAKLEVERRLTKDAEGRVGRLIDWFGRVLDVTTKGVSEWVDGEAKRGVCAGTIKRNMNVLKAVLRHGKERGMVDELPTFPTLKVDDARDVHLEPDEVDSLLRWAEDRDEEEYLPFVLLVDTGLRLGEMCELRVRDLDFENGTIRVNKRSFSKTKTRMVPMTKRVRIALEVRLAMGELRPSDRVWGRDSKGAAVFLGRALKWAIQELGLPEVRVHDLRHTFAYRAALAGADIADIQTLLGHANINMTMRYRGFVKSRTHEVVARMS